MPVATAALVPAAVMRLREQAPGVELSLVEDIAAGLWAQFERNEFDLLVTRLDARTLGSGLQQRRLFQDQHRMVCRPGTRWRAGLASPGAMPCATPG
jgi:DNA-binding transcriptional LysR family regulator